MKDTLIKFVTIVVGVTIALIVYGYFFSNLSFGAVSPVGVSNSSSKIATITMAPSTAAATTTSILNTDSSDRGITSAEALCTGVGTSQTYLTGTGLASLQVQMATSTVGSLGLQGNTNYAANVTVATSSAWSYVSSSTEPVISSMSRVWPTGTYLNIAFNATNTAACTVGVRYLSL